MGFLKNLFGIDEIIKIEPRGFKNTDYNCCDKSAGFESRPEMTDEEFKEGIKDLNKFIRRAYVPDTEETKPEFNDVSKFGGYPYLRQADYIPRCPCCGRYMQLFVQLDLSTLPGQKYDEIFQMFSCVNDENDCQTKLDDSDPFSKIREFRRFTKSENSSLIVEDIGDVFPEMKINSWTSETDYPHPDEYDDIDVDLDEDVIDEIYEREECLPIPDDKLYGWPDWVQAPEYIEDPTDEKKYKYFFQIGSDDNLPFAFGDAGTGHIMINVNNSKDVGFVWSSH